MKSKWSDNTCMSNLLNGSIVMTYVKVDLEGWPGPWYITTPNVQLYQIQLYAKYECLKSLLVQRELGVPRNTCVTCSSSSENWINSKCIERLELQCIYFKHDVALYHTLSMGEISLQWHQQNRSYLQDKKKWQREITSKILMQEFWTLCMTLPLTKVYPCMKFHFNSVCRRGCIVRTRKSDKVQ